ncbi:MAG TPA: TetR family transcriptional regulator [Ruminococcaceae bacterium]|nr:TetR family transcriptional regulator [Oscillospiraceae bacterium]
MKESSRQLQKQRTRDMLLHTAYLYFSEHGIRNTRMSDIAQAAGVSHGTVFLHFKTQEELIAEVVGTCCGKIARRTHELAGECGSLEEMLKAHLDGIREYEAFYTRLVVESRMLPQSARDAWISVQSAVSLHLSPFLEKAVAEAGLSGTPASMLFHVWMGLIHYYLANSDLFAPDGKVVERYGDAWISTFLQLLRQRPEKLS